MLPIHAPHICFPCMLPMDVCSQHMLPVNASIFHVCSQLYATHACMQLNACSTCMLPMYASIYATLQCMILMLPILTPCMLPMYSTLTLLCMLPMHEKMRGGMQMYGKVLPCSICYSGFLCISPMYASHGYSRACSPIPMYGK